MTCAIKNNVGTIEGRSESGSRKYLHQSPDLSIPFLENIANIAALINPELNIVDARDILIGNGPMHYMPGAEVKKGINKLVLCGDIVATDAYCAERILSQHDPGFSPENIAPTLNKAEQLGLGTPDLKKVDILEIDETWEPPRPKAFYPAKPNSIICSEDSRSARSHPG